MASIINGSACVAAAEPVFWGTPPETPRDRPGSLSISASAGQNKHMNRDGQKPELEALLTPVGSSVKFPVRNTAIWDGHFASELETYCQHISVEVKDHCDTLVSMIAEKILMGDTSNPIAQTNQQGKGSGRKFDSSQFEHRNEPQPPHPSVKQAHISMNMIEGAVGGTENDGEFVATGSGSVQSSHETDLALTPVQTQTHVSRRQCSTRTGHSSNSLEDCHKHIEEVMTREASTVGFVTERQQLFACLCPCFSRFFLPRHVKVDGERTESGDGKKPRKSHRETVQTTVGSSSFDIAIGWLIIMNCFVMIVQYQHYGYEARISLGMIDDDNGLWPNADAWFNVIEHIFNALFVLELCARLYVFRCRVFRECSSVLDIGCVVLSSIQLYVLDAVANVETGGNFTLFRMLRLLRFVRVMRIVRVMSIFSELRVLVKTCISSLNALAWSMILLFIIMVISGLLLCELLRGYIKDPSKSLESRKWVFKYYGTSTRAIYTLFEVTLAGCWPNYFRPLIHDVSVFFVGFSIIYITLVVFAIIRIITAIFLRETLNVATKDADMMLEEQNKSKQRYIQKLRTVFEALDASGDGKLDVTEFRWISEHPEIKTWFKLLDLEIHDVEALFRLLDDGDGELSYDEFLCGIMRMKGQARSIDVVSMMRTSDKTLEVVKHVQMNLEQILRSKQVFANGLAC